jgi:hypothetical protein
MVSDWMKQYGVQIMGGAALMAILGLIVLVTWFTRSGSEGKLDREGVTVTGRVLGGEERGIRQKYKLLYLDVSYRSADGVDHRREFSVLRETYDRAMESKTIPVIYLPADPAQARIDREDTSVTPLLLGLALTLAGTGALAFIGLKARSSK